VGLFNKRPPADVEAAAAKVRLQPSPHSGFGWGVGISRLAPVEFAPAIDVYSREQAMSLPTIKRSRDLICSAVGGLPLTQFTLDFTVADPVETRVPPASWMIRPDPNHTRQYTLAWTVDDLMFNGRAYWLITSRYATSFPASFQWVPFSDISIDYHSGKVSHGTKVLDPADVVEFCSPIDSLLWCGYKAIQTAINLDNAAERFSTNEIPAGWLEQTPDSEPLEQSELETIATAFQAARQARTVAALNPYLRWKESAMDPSKLQLVEARTYQSLELARLANVPAYMVSAPVSSGMTYTNSVQAKSDLLDFGALPYLQCIEQTLSGDNVLPRGNFCRFDLEAWLRNPLTPGSTGQNDAQIATDSNPDPAPTPAANVNDGRPRQADGQNATTTGGTA